jgi:6-phosphogluconolactonase
VRKIEIYPDTDHLAQAAAAFILDQARLCLAENKRFNLVLAGGSTPQAAYRLFAKLDPDSRIDWHGVHFFFSDERCVPPGHPDSNYAMARRLLFDHLPLLPGNIHRMPGELTPMQGAAAYSSELREAFAGADFPEFDLVLLGMGEDGHVASLFPGSAALQEQRRWVVAVEQVGVKGQGILKGVDSRLLPPLVDRLSLTLPVINAACQVLMLVSGAKKARRLSQVLNETPGNEALLPAQLVHPFSQRVTWLVDEAAAAGISAIPGPAAPEEL